MKFLDLLAVACALGLLYLIQWNPGPHELNYAVAWGYTGVSVAVMVWAILARIRRSRQRKAQTLARTERLVALNPIQTRRDSEGLPNFLPDLLESYLGGEIDLVELQKEQAPADKKHRAAEERKRKAAEEMRERKRKENAARLARKRDIYAAVEEEFGKAHLDFCNRLWTRTNDNVQANSQLKTWLNKAKALGALAANPADAQALDEWEIGIGATAPVVKMILGAPRDTTFTQLKTKRREYWYYQGETSNRGNVVYQFRVVLENDVVTRFGDGEFRT